MKKYIVILLSLALNIFFCNGQGNLKTKLFIDVDNKIEFEIPQNWKMELTDAVDKKGYACESMDSLEMEIYDDCFDSIIFRYIVHPIGFKEYVKLDYRRKKERIYAMDLVSNEILTTSISKDSYEGIYYVNNCGFRCEESGEGLGECEHILIGNTKKTVEFSTLGRILIDEVRDCLIESLRIE